MSNLISLANKALLKAGFEQCYIGIYSDQDRDLWFDLNSGGISVSNDLEMIDHLREDAKKHQIIEFINKYVKVKS
jgi:hypothetical protein